MPELVWGEGPWGLGRPGDRVGNPALADSFPDELLAGEAVSGDGASCAGSPPSPDQAETGRSLECMLSRQLDRVTPLNRPQTAPTLVPGTEDSAVVAPVRRYSPQKTSPYGYCARAYGPRNDAALDGSEGGLRPVWNLLNAV